MICVLFIYPSLYSLSSLSSLCSLSIAWFFWHLSIFFFRTLVSHVVNAVSFGDCWFHTSEYNTVNTKCLNLITFLGDSFQGICWQSHSTEWIERPKIFSENYQSFFIHYDSRQRRMVQSWESSWRLCTFYIIILYLSILSPNQVPDSLIFVFILMS